IPREKNRVTLPTYTIEPPDVLLLDALRLIPKPPYVIEPLDGLVVAFPANPGGLKETELTALAQLGYILAGPVRVEPDGNIRLGAFRTGQVAGKTIDEAEKLVVNKISKIIDPKLVERGRVVVAVGEVRGLQQIKGEHLVRPDGTINLGIYGSVYVTGKTEKEARKAIED